MRVVVVGCGGKMNRMYHLSVIGVGGYFGARLIQQSVDVTFIARSGNMANKITLMLRRDPDKTSDDRFNSGKYQEYSGNLHFSPSQFKSTDDVTTVDSPDIVFITVKTWQLKEIANQIKPMIKANTTIIPLQNGVDASDILSAVIGKENVVGGCCRMISFIVEPGHIRHAGINVSIHFGTFSHNPPNHHDNLVKLKAIFDSGVGVTATLSDNIGLSLWEKFVVICGNAGATSVTRSPMGIVTKFPETRKLMLDLMSEVISLGKAQGIPISQDLAQKNVDFAVLNGQQNPGNTTSMHRDISQGKPSELFEITGFVVRMGKSLGIATPVNDFVFASLLPSEMIARGEIKLPD